MAQIWSFGIILAWLLAANPSIDDDINRRSGSGGKQPPSLPSLTVNQILDWLPANTETLVVAQGPFLIEAADEKEVGEAPLDKMLERFSLGPTWDLSDGVYGKILKDQTVALVVEGSRGFRSPANLGMMPYEGCHLIVFQNDLGSVGDTLRKALKADALKVQELAGHPVFLFEKKLEDDQWKFLVTQPRPNLLVWATDQSYLEEVLKRMRQKEATRALPADLAEWKQLDTKARFWAIRHYDKTNAANDPSSPLTTDRRAANQPDLQAVGLVFTFDPKRDPLARVKYLSGNKEAAQIAAQGWTHPSEKLEPKIRPGPAGIVEITVELKDHRTSHMFLFVLLAGLGHAIYL